MMEMFELLEFCRVESEKGAMLFEEADPPKGIVYTVNSKGVKLTIEITETGGE